MDNSLLLLKAPYFTHNLKYLMTEIHIIQI